MPSLDTILLAGGKGTRLRSAISDVPKPLAPINGTPFMDILLERLSSVGIVRDIVISVCHQHHLFLERYRSGFLGKEISFSVESTPLGTGGAIWHAVEKTVTENVMVLNTDSYLDLDFDAFLRFHISKACDISMAVVQQDDCTRYGSIQIDDRDRIQAFWEKRRSKKQGYINAGIYIFNREVLGCKSFAGSFSLEEEFFPYAAQNLNFCAYAVSGAFIDIGTPEAYSQAQAFFLKRANK